MTFNLSSVAFAVFFTLSLHLAMIHAGKDSAHYIDYALIESTEPESDHEPHIQSHETVGGKSGSKRSRIETASSRSEVKRMKYRDRINPIEPEIDSDMVNFLTQKELDLKLKSDQRLYFWENYEEEATKERMKFLCKNAWVSLKPRLKFKKELTDDMKPDCDGALILGPSYPSSPNKKFIGYLQYLPELEETSFFADILKCNCAYLNWKKLSKRYGTHNCSNYFFYILKMTENIYYVLTQFGGKGSRDLKIVSVINV